MGFGLYILVTCLVVFRWLYGVFGKVLVVSWYFLVVLVVLQTSRPPTDTRPNHVIEPRRSPEKTDPSQAAAKLTREAAGAAATWTQRLHQASAMLWFLLGREHIPKRFCCVFVVFAVVVLPIPPKTTSD